MTTLYKLLLVLSLLGILGSCLFIPPRGVGIEKYLVRHIDDWEVNFKTQDATHFGITEDKCKSDILACLKRCTRDEPAVPAGAATGALVIFILSFLGLRREKHFRKLVEPIDTSNPHSPSAQGADGR